ncbi:MAG: NAD(P)H-dependent oxidoreductase [Campylobacterales bacterium]|nr:NAD(P)H-dependent oxidoreductase [Campylobacterales bacterium]
MKKTLVVLAHPNLEKSVVNKALVDRLSQEENITINDLYSKYSDFKIDVEKEQQLLLENDVIVFQFPFQWLSSPALLKEWFDNVFALNFAFGEAFKLEGKKFVVSTSTGSAEKEYQKDGANKATIEEFLMPFCGTANHTKMEYQKPMAAHGAFSLSKEDIENHGNKLVDYLKSL